MTTMTFISMIVALILVIVAIARVQGSPKLGINLILTLAFAIVVGFGIQSKTRNRKGLCSKPHAHTGFANRWSDTNDYCNN